MFARNEVVPSLGMGGIMVNLMWEWGPRRKSPSKQILVKKISAQRPRTQTRICSDTGGNVWTKWCGPPEAEIRRQH